MSEVVSCWGSMWCRLLFLLFVCSLHRQRRRSSVAWRGVEGLAGRLLHVPLRQRHHRSRGVRLLQRAGAGLPPNRGDDHQHVWRHELLSSQSLRWANETLVQVALITKRTKKHWHDAVIWHVLQFVTRVCAIASLLSVNMGKSWCRTTDQSPAVRTTSVVSFLFYRCR